ncbi:MAG TPA: tetratricopeptide repeat protein [Rubrobacteraceae bacterium]|nr:tetratricopeptide repeat protein [Rubrobacteraceae bacterium]
MEPGAKGTKSLARNDLRGVALEDRLLATKLYAPSDRANLVTRPRLTKRLDKGVSGKLTLLCAPAGFGKSTLLGEWVLQGKLPVGWLSLDEGDNDPTRFLSYAIAALQTVEADVGVEALSLLRSSQPAPIQAVLTALVNEISAVPHDLGLVLDDYHVIEEEAVHHALAFLLEHLPPQMHLVVASRTEPPLSLSRLLAGGQLTRLSASDLRFTPEEAAAFLKGAMGLHLTAEDVAALEETTEGWIAGLQLAALSLRERNDTASFVSAFTGTNRHVFDYLAEEVLDSQAEDARTFLLETSILDRLTAPLCDATTGRGGGQAMLEQLERANLLMVPLDDERRWYRYHHLFSDFLRERLRRENAQLVPVLHLRASVWHETNGTAAEAVGHALAARNFKRAGDLIERLADSMVGSGETPTLERLMAALPEEVLRSRPRLCQLYAALVLMATGRLDTAEAWLRDVERMLDLGALTAVEGPSPRSPDARDDRERAKEAGYVVTVRATIAMDRGDLRSAIALNRRALELLVDETQASARGVAAVNLSECLLDVGDLPAARRSIDEAIDIGRAAYSPDTIAWSLWQLGRLQFVQGRVSEAISTYERVLRMADGLGGSGLLRDIGAAHIGVGESLLERDELEATSRHLSEGVELVLEWSGLGEATIRLLEGTGVHDRLGKLEQIDIDAAQVLVTGYIALARAKQAQGEAEGAFEMLRKVEQVAHNAYVSPLWRNRTMRWLDVWRARLRMVEGNTRPVERWARERRLSAEDGFEYSPESELEYATFARLLIVQGKHVAALKLLERLLEAAQIGGRGRTVIEVLVLKALALQARNDEPGALAALRRALALAEPERYVRTFADEGAPIANLLRRLLEAHRKQPADDEGDVPREYVGTLLEALGVGIVTKARYSVRSSAELVLDPLTERELQVLKLLDSDLSNREIAARLFVSLATVKTHTKHLYRKLGVNARHRAIVRGKELGLL